MVLLCLLSTTSGRKDNIAGQVAYRETMYYKRQPGDYSRFDPNGVAYTFLHGSACDTESTSRSDHGNRIIFHNIHNGMPSSEENQLIIEVLNASTFVFGSTKIPKGYTSDTLFQQATREVIIARILIVSEYHGFHFK